jgi:hypothetical protein
MQLKSSLCACCFPGDLCPWQSDLLMSARNVGWPLLRVLFKPCTDNVLPICDSHVSFIKCCVMLGFSVWITTICLILLFEISLFVSGKFNSRYQGRGVQSLHFTVSRKSTFIVSVNVTCFLGLEALFAVCYETLKSKTFEEQQAAPHNRWSGDNMVIIKHDEGAKYKLLVSCFSNNGLRTDIYYS